MYFIVVYLFIAKLFWQSHSSISFYLDCFRCNWWPGFRLWGLLLSVQGVHDSHGIHEDYLKLESLVQKVVSPYLGTHGLFSGDGTDANCCILGESVLSWRGNGAHLLWNANISKPCAVQIPEKCLPWPKSADQLSKNPVVRSKSYNIPLLLTPVAEYDPDAGSVGSGGIRRHSACEIISCLEDQALAYSDLASGPELSGPSSNRLCVGSHFNGRTPCRCHIFVIVNKPEDIIHPVSSGSQVLFQQEPAP